MSYESWTWTTEEVLPSVLGSSDDFMRQMLAQLEQNAWGEHDIFAIRLATEEALVNAIRHGNALDQRKCVQVVCRMSPQKFWVQISDEGPGFNPDEVPDPTAPENLERPGGRGVMLMRNFMSSVEFSSSGNRVIMEKCRLDGAGDKTRSSDSQ